VDEAQYAIASEQLSNMPVVLNIVGPMEEINTMLCHIFGGAEEPIHPNPGRYSVFFSTRSGNIYEGYSYQIYRNGVPLGIESVIREKSEEVGGVDRTHISISASYMTQYDASAIYTLVVTYQSHSATYQIWQKYDPASQYAMDGKLIEEAA